MRTTLLAALMATSAAGVLNAQLAQRPQGVAAPEDSISRARLEGEIRRNFARVVRNRIGLNDAQMAKLGPISQRYEQQRRQLQVEERDSRVALRQMLRDESTADSAQVSKLLRTLVELQQRRSHVLAAEQIELATIMSPIQRAKYMAMQEQIRRRLEQMRQRRMQLEPGEGDAPIRPQQRRRPPV